MTQKAPRGLRRAGKALWGAVTEDFDLDEHELQLLTQAARTADLCDSLQVILDRDGPMAESSQGIRAHPAAVELRQQRIALARLFAALNLPTGEAGEASSHRAPRGVYGIRGAVG